ncbi:MAG: hypothetical protein GX663_09300 [Clostridiales bacterium]|nr:hypothetical protein [Clostridiales bacterium]
MKMNVEYFIKNMVDTLCDMNMMTSCLKILKIIAEDYDFDEQLIKSRYYYNKYSNDDLPKPLFLRKLYSLYFKLLI